MGRFDGLNGYEILGHIKGLGHGYPVGFKDADGKEYAGTVYFDDMACYDPGQLGGEFAYWVLELEGEHEPFIGTMTLVAGDALESLRDAGYVSSQYAPGMGWMPCPWYAREAEAVIREAAHGAGILAREVRSAGDNGLRPLVFTG